VRIQTFAASTPARLDRKVNAFLAQPDIEVRRLHPAMSFGTYMVVVEYDQRGSPAAVAGPASDVGRRITRAVQPEPTAATGGWTLGDRAAAAPDPHRTKDDPR
jgi:hypothetical protein